jgi:hypothetical protein
MLVFSAFKKRGASKLLVMCVFLQSSKNSKIFGQKICVEIECSGSKNTRQMNPAEEQDAAQSHYRNWVLQCDEALDHASRNWKPSGKSKRGARLYSGKLPGNVCLEIQWKTVCFLSRAFISFCLFGFVCVLFWWKLQRVVSVMSVQTFLDDEDGLTWKFLVGLLPFRFVSSEYNYVCFGDRVLPHTFFSFPCFIFAQFYIWHSRACRSLLLINLCVLVGLFVCWQSKENLFDSENYMRNIGFFDKSFKSGKVLKSVPDILDGGAVLHLNYHVPVLADRDVLYLAIKKISSDQKQVSPNQSFINCD